MTAYDVLQVELAEPLRALASPPRGEGVFVVFRWKGVVLGHVEVGPEQLPMASAQVANVAAEAIAPVVEHYLAGTLDGGATLYARADPLVGWLARLRLDRPLAAALGDGSRPGGSRLLPSISVAVCTRDRPESLQRCLESLTRSSLPPHEVLVVDNAPRTSATRRLVEAKPGLCYVLEPRPGLGRARNAAVRHTTGDIIAFTDDDVEVDRDWIASLQQAFLDPRVAAVTGLVLPGELKTEAQLLFEWYHSFNMGYRVRTFDQRFLQRASRKGVHVWTIGAGANMAVRRAAVERVTGFDERLGAGAAGCSEDSEFWYRLLAEGLTIRYDPRCVVAHYHRREMAEFKRQMRAYMRGHVVALLIQFDNHRHWGNLWRVFVTLPLYYAKRIARGLRAGFGPVHRSLWQEMSGCLAGIGYFVRHRRTERPELSAHPSGRRGTLTGSVER